MTRRDLAAFLVAAPASAISVSERGAVGDGSRLDTKAIQDAIDACGQAGGGIVSFPPGRYLSATLVLRDRVILWLDPGATLLGSPNLADYPSHVPKFRSYTDSYTEKSLIYAEGVTGAGIHGFGTLDGQGAAFKGPYKVRPYMLRFVSCRDISMEGITIRNSPMWVQHYLDCEGVSIRGVTVNSRANANNDGIDIDCCRRVRISDCDISSGDDSIVLKSTADQPTTDVTVTNCVISSHCNGLKLGTETNGGFENISISNCTVYDTRLAGLALEMVDGGSLDRVTVSNLTMKNAGTPIFIRLGNRARPFRENGPAPGMGRFRNVTIENIEGTSSGRTGCAVAGLPGYPIEDLTIANVRLTFPGGGTAAEAERVPDEVSGMYPEHNMFGVLPAYGFWIRHASNVKLKNVEMRFVKRDDRPPLICDDVEGLELDGLDLTAGPEASCAARLRDVRKALVRGCRAKSPVASWLHITGKRTARISVIGNDLAGAGEAIRLDDGAAASAVFQAANRTPES